VVERPPPASIPDAPGSYQFLDADGRVLYVGKAKSLRQRLASYFADPATLAPRTAQLVAQAARVEWIQVANETEALLLEYSLIKRHRPRFNVRLVDDKSYPWLAVTVSDPWPRAAVVRGRRRSGTAAFGPFTHAKAARETLDLVVRSFPVRTCSDGKFRRHQAMGRPCLLFHIERCSGPCVGAVDPATYRGYVEDLMAFFAGDTEALATRLRQEMAEAAEQLAFERAARLRDQLASLELATARQEVVLDRPEDLDVLGLAEDPLQAAVCVLRVRRGRLVGRRVLLVDRAEELDQAGLLGRVLEELYADAGPPERSHPGGPGRARPAPADWELVSGAGDPTRGRSAEGELDQPVPRQVLLPTLPEAAEAHQALLGDRRGGPVTLSVPQRGAKRRLLETAQANALEELRRARSRRAADHAARAAALDALQEVLGLPQAPLRIECYDMSHLQGTDYVGSMVVLEDGLPRPSEYRRFKIRSVPGNDDYAAMGEVLERRLGALLRERARAAEGTEGRARRFAYPPQLLLVDGGKGQLGVAVAVLERLGLAEEIPVAALAKAFEEVFVPGRPDPLRIPYGSPALLVLQQARDEAHRFAVGYHRRLRSARMTRSALDQVPGLGPARRRALLRHYGSLRRLRAAPLEELAGLPFLPATVAEALFAHLHGPSTPAEPSSPSAPEAGPGLVPDPVGVAIGQDGGP
jgi:excinuclease ABC subunit C